MRTWEENRSALNQLWPTWKVTEEERRLWNDDLSGLDQTVLYDAIRNVKRTHDAPWPQLKWVLDAFRDLDAARKQITRTYVKAEPKLTIEVDEANDRKLVEDFRAYIEAATPSEHGEIQEMILDKLPQMHARSAFMLLRYATARFFPDRIGLSRVTREGNLVPIQPRFTA